jgi:hypothetical protein
MTQLKMMKVFGAAAVLSLLAAGPVIAGPKQRPVANNQVCDPRDPGNPFSERYDYETWTRWRARGGWDTRAEWTCQPIPSYAHNKGFDVGPY